MQNRLSAVPARMLICFLGRHRGERLVAASKAAGAKGGTLALGQSLGNSRILQALSLADIQQDVVFTLMRGEAPAVLAAVKKAAGDDPRRLSGTAVVLNVPEMFIRADGGTPSLSPGEEARSETMESGYKLIAVIVNAGFADDVMAKARTAGAKGGTIINARGTGTEEDVKFFGISLVPEKEMLLIVSPPERVRPISEAVATIPTLSEPGGGVMFTMNVEEFILLGNQTVWQEE